MMNNRLNDKSISLNNQTIELSNLQKNLFGASNITKEDLITYYQKISDIFLPHVQNHLIVMHRFPDGIDHEGFYQKEVPEYFPKWIKTAIIDLKSGDKQELLLINKTADLVYLANQAVITFHSWLSRYDKPDYPDKIVFDMDPSEKNSLDQLYFALIKTKEILEEHDLVPFVMTTGSRGYHIVVPIKPEHDFDSVREFAKNIAQTLSKKYNDRLTTEMHKSERKERVFVDYLRNSYGQTSVAPYSVRALENAPIATPLEWSELTDTTPQGYTIKSIFKRLAQKEDPWRDFNTYRRRLYL